MTKSKKEQHVNLLFVQDHYVDEDNEKEEKDEIVPKFHYIWIKDLSRLVGRQLSLHNGKKFICDRCLHYFRSEEKLKAHEVDCAHVNKYKVKLPTEKEKILKFKNFKNNERVPFVLYADFECLLKSVPDNERAYQQHDDFSVGSYVKCSFDEAHCGYTSYRKDEEDGQKPAEWFVDKLRELVEELNDAHKNPQLMNDLTLREKDDFRKATHCYMCRKPFTNQDKKVTKKVNKKATISQESKYL